MARGGGERATGPRRGVRPDPLADTTDNRRGGVTDHGLTVEQTPTPWLGTGAVQVPFGVLTRVQFCLPDRGENSHLTEADKRQGARDLRMTDDPLRFLVARQSGENALETGAKLGGIRIERSIGPAIYVGSDHPQELATVLACRSEHVAGAEKFTT